MSLGWRGLMVAAALMIGLLNPFLCMLHCMLTAHAPAFGSTNSSRAAYYCGFTDDRLSLSTDTANDDLSRSSRPAITVFFGGAEGVPTHSSTVLAALAVVTWVLAYRPMILSLLAFPPLPPHHAQTSQSCSTRLSHPKSA